MFPSQQSPSTAPRMLQNAICFQDFHFAVASTNLKVVQKLPVFLHSVARPHFNDPRFFEKPTSSLSFHGDRHPPSPPQVAEGCVFSEMSTLRSCMHARQLHRKTFELQGSTVDTAVQRSSMLAESRTFPKFPPSPSHRPVLICSESKNSESHLCDRRQQCTRVFGGRPRSPLRFIRMQAVLNDHLTVASWPSGTRLKFCWIQSMATAADRKGSQPGWPWKLIFVPLQI